MSILLHSVWVENQEVARDQKWLCHVENGLLI